MNSNPNTNDASKLPGQGLADTPRRLFLRHVAQTSPNPLGLEIVRAEGVYLYDAGGSAYQIAEAYALRNDANSTFEWLDRAWSNRDQGMQYLLFDPFILRYKDDPRFAAFCRKLGLPVPQKAGESTRL